MSEPKQFEKWEDFYDMPEEVQEVADKGISVDTAKAAIRWYISQRPPQAEEPPEKIDWERRRFELVLAALSNSSVTRNEHDQNNATYEQMAKWCVRLADAGVAELKEKKP